MLSPKEIQAEVEEQYEQDETVVKDFVKKNGGNISTEGDHMLVSFKKDLDSQLAGKTFRASNWHNLRAAMLKQGRMTFSD